MTVVIDGTLGVRSVNGSAAAPSVTGTDTDTGIVYGTNTITLATGGTAGLIQDSTQNVGIAGVTPSSWGSAFRALQLNSGAIFSNTNGAGMYMCQNTYYNGTAWIASSTGGACIYTQNSAVHSFFANSVTSGSSITPTSVLSVGKDTTLALQGATSSAGTGIAFPVDQYASSDARTLDDYEEGIWTPSLGSSGSTPTVSSYTDRTGTYTKIGNLVTATCNIRATLSNVGTGYPIITGLPFNSAGFLDGVSFGLITIVNGISSSGGGWFVAGSFVYAGQSLVYNLNNQAYMTFTVSYRVA